MIKKLLLLATCVVALAFLLALQSPKGAGLPLYLAVFFLVYIICVVVTLLFIELAYSHIGKNKQLFNAVVLGFSPVILLALASLSSLSLVDVLLAVGIPSAVVWYSSRRGVMK